MSIGTLAQTPAPTAANASPQLSPAASTTANVQITSPVQWAVVLLKYMNLPVTPSNVSFLVGWAVVEGGNWHNTATGNPLNTTLRAPGSQAIAGSSAGVQAYPSWATGIEATAQTLQAYPEIMAGLRAGDAAAADLAGSMGPDLSRWSGGGYSVVPPSNVSSTQVANLDLSIGQVGSDVLKGLGWLFTFGASGAAVGTQAAGGAAGLAHGVGQIGTFFASLGQGITWVRFAEIVGGFLVIGVGLYLYAKVAFPGVLAAARRTGNDARRVATTAAMAAA